MIYNFYAKRSQIKERYKKMAKKITIEIVDNNVARCDGDKIIFEKTF